MRNPLTPAGIEPANFRFVAQHLNHCATAAPLSTPVLRYSTFPIFYEKFQTIKPSILMFGKEVPPKYWCELILGNRS